jgi:hypothetical protein
MSHKRPCAIASNVPSWHALSDIGPAITLRGAQITEAILSGKKDIENRKVRLPVGCWIALHTGKSQIYDFQYRMIRRFAPSDDDVVSQQYPSAAASAVGAVVGFCWISSCVPIEDLRNQFNCCEECDEVPLDCSLLLTRDEFKFLKKNETTTHAVSHVKTCRLSPFAVGPVCNIISAVLRLPRAVPCSGKLNCWKLPLLVVDQIKLQLSQERPPIQFMTMRASGSTLPRPWPLPWCGEDVERYPVVLNFRKKKKKKEKKNTVALTL